ncbi:CLUMA_CG005413, isoform A [Clunio marinus]|uniref:CLUMA_CG005413, isoform A n=1 Tax=Clunio marinus TaxID=568069 RepID=A0A1J1HUV2_9DIPT|nr:CLUMA_CG005413, isoform A [Clunio marinus]
MGLSLFKELKRHMDGSAGNKNKCFMGKMSTKRQRKLFCMTSSVLLLLTQVWMRSRHDSL